MTSITMTATPRIRSARWALSGLALSILLASLGTSIANIALPTLAQTFGASIRQIQWVVLAYLLAITTLIVSVGRLGDVVGRRRLFLAGIAVFTIASIACGVAPTLATLIAARAVQGLGAAVMTTLTLAFAGEAVPKEKTGSAMGMLGTMSALGTALGPTLGGVLIAAYGWRSIFLANVPLGVVALLLVDRHLPVASQDARRVRFDIPGTLLLAMTLAAYALAMTRAAFLLLIVAVCGAVLFVLAERRAASPLVRLELLRDRRLATNALVTTVVMATLVVGPFYLSRTLGLDAARVGLAMSCGPIVSALTGVPAGRIVDRFGTRRTILAGLTAMFLGAALLAAIPASLGVIGYIAPLAVLTAGYALFQAANNTAVMTDVHGDQRGVVSGMLNLSRNLGLITGASVMAAVFATAGMRMTFVVAAGLIAIAMAIRD